MMNFSRSSCPCCAFLEQDLFLPPQEPSTSEPAPSDTTSANSPAIPEQNPASPKEALQVIHEYCEELRKRQQSTDIAMGSRPPILLVDTHNHAHLRRERHEAYMIEDDNSSIATGTNLVSLSMAVEVPDWEDAIKYSAAEEMEKISENNEAAVPTTPVSDWTLFGLGIHPWYLENISPEGEWIETLDSLLKEHPSAVVGEIGLCKMAKCARNHPEGKSKGFELQRSVLETQIKMATRHQRPVSVHCVQQHGVFMDILKDFVVATSTPEEHPRTIFPPAIAMHSFTGTAHHVKALLTWEATLFGEGPNNKKRKKKKGMPEDGADPNSPSTSNRRRRPPLLYFGFSHIVNYGMCTSEKARRQGVEAVRAVPIDRLLAESDVHHPLDVAAGTAGAVAYIAWALGRPIPEAAELTARNGLRFLQTHISRTDTG